MVLNIPSSTYNYLSSVSPSLLTLKDLFLIGMTPPVASQFYKLCHVHDVNGYNPHILSGVDHDLWIRLSSKTIFVSFCTGSPPTIGKANVVRITKISRTLRSKLSFNLETISDFQFGLLFYFILNGLIYHIFFQEFYQLIQEFP